MLSSLMGKGGGLKGSKLQGLMGNSKLQGLLGPLMNQKRSQLTNDKTGLSPLVTEGGAMAANAILPGSGTAVKALSGLDNMITGDGTSAGKNLVGDILNPLSPLQALSEGKFEEAIPIYGAFANARNNKKKQFRLKEDQRSEYMDSQIRRSKNLINNQSRGTTMYNMGGLVPLSSSGGMIKGAQHEQGGVSLGGNVEAEGGEMMSEVQGGDYIFPNEQTAQENPEIAVNPKTGNSYSEDIAKLESKKGELESKLDKRPNDFRIKNAIKRIEAEIEKLAKQHQMQLEANNVPTEGVPEGQQQVPQQVEMGQQAQQPMMQEMMGQMQMKYGGKKKYNPGGFKGNPYLDDSPMLERVPLLSSISSKLDLGDPKEMPMPQKIGLNPKNGSGNNSILNNVGEYAPLAMDNAFNYMQNRQRAKADVPRQNTSSYIQPRLVNYDNQRQAISNQTRGMRDMISQTTNQSNIARANMQNSLAKRLSALGDVNLAETNKNQQILATNDAANNDIETRNNAVKYKNDLEKFKWEDSIRAKDSQNVADLSKDIQTAKKDKAGKNLDMTNQRINLAAIGDVRVLKSLRKSMKKSGADSDMIKLIEDLIKAQS